MKKIKVNVPTSATIDFALATGRLELKIDQLFEKIGWCPDWFDMQLFHLTDAFNKFQTNILWAQQYRAMIIDLKEQHLPTKDKIDGHFEVCGEDLEAIAKLYGELLAETLFNSQLMVLANEHGLLEGIGKDICDVSKAIHKSLGELFDEVTFGYMLHFNEGKSK